MKYPCENEESTQSDPHTQNTRVSCVCYVCVAHPYAVASLDL